MSIERSFVRGFASGALLTLGLGAGVVGTGIAAGTLGSSLFSDVAPGSSYDEAIGELVGKGVMSGVSVDKFGANDAVTRGQLAIILQKLRADILRSVPTQTITTVRAASTSSSSTTRNRSSLSVNSSSSTSRATASTMSKNPSGIIRFTSYAYNAPETQGKVQIAIVRVGGTTGTVSVDYKTLDGTAVTGTDYDPIQGSVTFTGKETSKKIDIVVKNNVLAQGHKSFSLVLSNITGGALLDVKGSKASVTIVDLQTSADAVSVATTTTASSSVSSNPSGVFAVNAPTYMAAENGATLNITIQRIGGSNGTATVNYGTTNGSATAGSAFQATSGTLTFSSGETSKTVPITIIDNTSIDGNRNFGLAITSPTGGALLGSTTTAIVTIFDNESGTYGPGLLRFSRDTTSVTRSSGTAKIIVLRTGGAEGTITVQYATRDYSAFAGMDYTAASGTLTFAPGEASKEILIPIAKTSSGVSNDGKNFSIDLQNPSAGVQLISPYNASVAIYN